MRRWLAAAGAAGSWVGERPATWLTGALAWLVTVGWIPLVVGVAEAPTLSDLTFLATRIFGSALWPWNAVAIVLGAAALATVALVLAAVADAALLDQLGGRRRGLRLAIRLVAIENVVIVPAAIALFVLAVALAEVAPSEFASPDRGAGPLVRTLARLAPFLVLLVVAAAAGSAIGVAAARLVHDRGLDTAGALLTSPRFLVSAGSAAILQLVVAGVARIAWVVVTAVLLRVLWAPVGLLLGGGERDALTIGLLVGFVAIWLCLVLAAGALHAWTAAGWSILLTGSAASPTPDRHRLETPIDR